MSNRALFSKLAKKQPVSSSVTDSTTRQSPRARKPNSKFKDFDLTSTDETLVTRTRSSSKNGDSSRKQSNERRKKSIERKSSKKVENEIVSNCRKTSSESDGFCTPRNYGESEIQWKSRSAFAKLAKSKPVNSVQKTGSLQKNEDRQSSKSSECSEEMEVADLRDDIVAQGVKRQRESSSLEESNKMKQPNTDTEDQGCNSR